MSTELYLLILAFSLGVFTAVVTIPPIVRVARDKSLFDSTGNRKVHHGSVPRLGGMAIFLGFLLSTIVTTLNYEFQSLRCIIVSVVLLFFIGLMDDVISVPAAKKFPVQFVSSLIVILMGDICITNFHGLFGLYSIPPVAGCLVTLLLMMAMINAFNLIDGVDGLASSLGILASLFFGTWFYFSDIHDYAIMAFALAGSLGGFFLFNVFGNRNKLFMGDNGSLMMGLLLSVLAIQFNEFSADGFIRVPAHSAPPVSFAVVAIPLVDTLRVMVIRILHRCSPFLADRNHIHHRLLLVFPKHLTVTLVILSGSIVIILLALLFSSLAINIALQFLLVFITTSLLFLVPSMLLMIKRIRKYHLSEQ